MPQQKPNQKISIRSISTVSVKLSGLLNEYLKLNRIHNGNELLLGFENELI